MGQVDKYVYVTVVSKFHDDGCWTKKKKEKERKQDGVDIKVKFHVSKIVSFSILNSDLMLLTEAIRKIIILFINVLINLVIPVDICGS